MIKHPNKWSNTQQQHVTYLYTTRTKSALYTASRSTEKKPMHMSHTLHRPNSTLQHLFSQLLRQRPNKNFMRKSVTLEDQIQKIGPYPLHRDGSATLMCQLIPSLRGTRGAAANKLVKFFSTAGARHFRHKKPPHARSIATCDI